MFLTAQGLALSAPGGSVPAPLTPETVRGGEEVGQPQHGEGRGSWAACLPSRRATSSGLTLVSPPARGLHCRGCGIRSREQAAPLQGSPGPRAAGPSPPGRRGALKGEPVAQGPDLLGRWFHLWLSGPKHLFFREDEARAYGRPGCQRGQPPQPQEASPPPTPTPHPIQRPCHPSLTIGGREVDGHCEVDLGPRGRRIAGRYLDGGGAGGGGAGLEGRKPGPTSCCWPVCGLSIWKAGM